MTSFKILVLAAAAATSMVSAQTITSDMITAIAKDNKECTTDSAKPDQCVPASQIAPYLEASFKQYKICSKNVMAAVTALMAFESVSFLWKENQSPGRPGQGTANMQMADFNQQYMDSIPELKGKWDSSSDDALRASLKLLIDNKYNFGSGPWYLTSHQECVDSKVQEALRKNPDEGWTAYMKCVGVDGTDADRLAFYSAAKTAFGSVPNEPECVSGASDATAPSVAPPPPNATVPNDSTPSIQSPVPPRQSSAASNKVCKHWRTKTPQ